MNYEQLKMQSESIINEALESIGSILNEIENLDPIIKENQIREFKKQWQQVFNSNTDIVPAHRIDDLKSSNQFKYLINRMNDQNRIKERIIKESDETLASLFKLWSQK